MPNSVTSDSVDNNCVVLLWILLRKLLKTIEEFFKLENNIIPNFTQNHFIEENYLSLL